jgi:cytochrome c-type biogenesis protein CcmH/NrfG
MISALLLFAPAALIAAVACWWVMRAYMQPGVGGNPTRVMMAAGAAAILVLVLYLAVGRPSAPDEPYAGRIAALEAKAKSDAVNMSVPEMLALLEAHAKTDVNDPRPLLFAGQILAEQGRDAEAARAFSGVLKRDPTSADAMIGLGRANVRLEGGVSPQTVALFQAASKLAPADPVPWFYQALAASQEERFADATRLWPEVLKRFDPADPRRTMALSMLEDAKRKTPQQPNR